MVTAIVSRQKEFAMIQSVGMTKRQLRSMLIDEGLYYAVRDIWNQDCKDNQNRCADYKGQECEMESRCPVTGYHHPHSNKDTESTQDIRYKERTDRMTYSVGDMVELNGQQYEVMAIVMDIATITEGVNVP